MRRSPKESELPAFDLRAAREAKSLTQVAVSILLCASQSSVARWENDGTLPLIYRKYWELYWLMHARAKNQLRKAKKKVARKVATVTVAEAA